MNDILSQAGIFSVFVSILLNIIVSISGVLPSAFITIANLTFFGLYGGLLVSIAGEAVGAIISFILYRKGLRKWKSKGDQNKVLLRLKNVEGKNAFWLILGLRILPFMPSGVVTLASAFSKVSIGIFAVASTIGKIPSLVIEAGAIYGFLNVNLKIQIGIIVIVVCYFIWRWKAGTK